MQNQRVSANANGEANGKTDDEMIDLNANPQRVHEPASNNHVLNQNLSIHISLYRLLDYSQSFSVCVFNLFCLSNEQGIDVNNANNHEPAGVVPVGPFKRESDK